MEEFISKQARARTYIVIEQVSRLLAKREDTYAQIHAVKRRGYSAYGENIESLFEQVKIINEDIKILLNL